MTESVELAKADAPRGGGLVNAVLRRAAREARGIVEALPDETPAQAALKHSHPAWIAELWFDTLGPDDARELMRADNRPAEAVLRANTLRLTASALAERIPGRVEGDALILDAPFDAFASPEWEQGLFMPQSRAAMAVSTALDPQPGERVLDLCAAPGGKTTHLAALMGDRGEVVAVERHPQRARALAAQAQRLHATSVRVHEADAKAVTADALGGRFDRVLIDPPCSGLGTLRTHPDLRWRATPESVEALRAEQEAIVAAARAVLAPGGRLVYSTCTLSPREEVVGGSVQRTFPHRDGTDGFYIAVDGD